MASTAEMPTRSPFLQLFHRKKRVNGTKSSDDLKQLSSTAPGLTLKPSTSPSFPPAAAPHPDSQMPRNDSKKKKDKKANTLPGADRKKSKKAHKGGFNDFAKSQSMDALLEEDPTMLVEALQAIADEQPIVARSIPKHAKIIEKDQATQLKNCIFEPEVYDSMLSDSLKVCNMLQSHLDQCIISVRSRSPESTVSPVATRRQNGMSVPASNGTPCCSPGVRRFPLKSCVQADV